MHYLRLDGRALIAAAALAVALPAAHATPGPKGVLTGGPQAQAAASSPPVEEMIVVPDGEASESERDVAMRMLDSHLANDRGRHLYLQHRYGEAAPHLLAAAKRGFKMAQARIGEILVLGLDDVEQDVEAGMGWLGVAASGTTIPSIRNRFAELRSRVPAHLQPKLTSVVAAYAAQYGGEAQGVNCERTKPLGTHMTKVRCKFEEEGIEGRYAPYLNRGYMGEMTFPGAFSLLSFPPYDGPMTGL